MVSWLGRLCYLITEAVRGWCLDVRCGGDQGGVGIALGYWGFKGPEVLRGSAWRWYWGFVKLSVIGDRYHK